MTKKPFIAKNGIVANGPTTNALGTVTGNATLDLSTGNVFQHTPSANTTFVFSNPPSSGNAYKFDLMVTGATVPSDTEGYDIVNATQEADFFHLDGSSNPRGITFSPDGTRVIVSNTSTSVVSQLNLSTPFDLSTATYSYSFIPASRTYFVTLSTDGTKLYVGDTSYSNVIQQYSLSQGFELSTATYDNVSYTLTETNQFSGIIFNPDGTKLYGVSTNADAVYQYSLSTPFDVSTITYDNISFSVVSQDDIPTGIKFSPDGTKFYLGGSRNKAVYYYTLTTPYDISTMSYSGTSFSTINESNGVGGITFNTDGSKMYICGPGVYPFGAAFEYDLSTAYSISTAVYNGISVNTSFGITTPKRVAFSPDGTKMYVDSAFDDISQFNLSTPFDVMSSTYANKKISFQAQDTTLAGHAFNNDGTKFFLFGYNTDTIYEYNLSTAYDVTTATYNNVSFSTATQNGAMWNITFNNDGTRLYTISPSSDTIYQYNLSTAFDLSTMSYSFSSLAVASQDGQPRSVAFNADGTKMFMIGATQKVFRYSLSTAFAINTASYDNVFFSVSFSPFNAGQQDIKFNDTGTKMYITESNIMAISQISTATPVPSTFAYPASVLWPDGVAPTDPAVGEKDMLEFVTTDGGTTYLGRVLGNNFS